MLDAYIIEELKKLEEERRRREEKRIHISVPEYTPDSREEEKREDLDEEVGPIYIPLRDSLYKFL